MCFKKLKKFKEYHISRAGLQSLVMQSYPAVTVFLDDNDYYYVSHEDWGKVITDVLIGMPKYTVEKFDCENFANLCRCRTSSNYKLNTMGVAVADIAKVKGVA